MSIVEDVDLGWVRGATTTECVGNSSNSAESDAIIAVLSESDAIIAALRAEIAALDEELEGNAALNEDIQQTLAETAHALFLRVQFVTLVLSSIVTYGGEDVEVVKGIAASALSDLGPFVVEANTDGRYEPDNLVVDAIAEPEVTGAVVIDGQIFGVVFD